MVERVLIQKSVHIKGAFTPNPSEPEFRTFRFDLVTGVKPPLDYGPEEKLVLGPTKRGCLCLDQNGL